MWNNSPLTRQVSGPYRPPAFLRLRSVILAGALVNGVRTAASRFVDLQNELKRSQRHGFAGPQASDFLRSSAGISGVPVAAAECIVKCLTDYNVDSLLSFKWSHVQHALRAYNLYESSNSTVSNMFSDLLSPYKISVEAVLAQIECRKTRSWIEAQLAEEEKEIAEIGSNISSFDFLRIRGREPMPRFIRWIDKDVYVQASSIRGGNHMRLPVVVLMGHVDHGKTTLLDTLQHSSIVLREPGKITQTIRAFMIGISHHKYPEMITVVDTPGHKVFAEVRIHGQVVGDIAVLLVALNEGVQGQTMEVVKIAQELKKPLVIAFNKTDLYSSPVSLARALRGTIEQLEELGITVHLVDSYETLQAMAAKKKWFGRFRWRTSPKKRPHRHCLAVAISGKHDKNVDLLVAVLAQLAQSSPLKCSDRSPMQAVVVESSENRGKVSISAVVRSGIARCGMPFVCDMTCGTIRSMSDAWGKEMPIMLPGYAGIVTTASMAKTVPASGIHIIEVDSEEEAQSVSEYRQFLQHFVEFCTNYVHFLRPKGMNCKFQHIGNYGQFSAKEHIEQQLCYDKPQPAETADDAVDFAWLSCASETLLDPSASQKMNEETVDIKSIIPILLKVDTWHTARLLYRELSRLSLRRARVELIGVTLGELKVKEVTSVANTIKAVICFRTPPLSDPQISLLLDHFNIQYRYFTVFTELVTYVKQLVVEVHRKSPTAETHNEYLESIVESIGLPLQRQKRSMWQLRSFNDSQRDS